MSAGTPVAAAAAHARRRILEELRELGAVSPDTSAPLTLPRPLDHRALARLLHDGLVVEDVDDRYYVDEEMFEDVQETGVKLRNFYLLLGLLAALMLVAFLLHGRI